MKKIGSRKIRKRIVRDEAAELCENSSGRKQYHADAHQDIAGDIHAVAGFRAGWVLALKIVRHHTKNPTTYRRGYHRPPKQIIPV